MRCLQSCSVLKVSISSGSGIRGDGPWILLKLIGVEAEGENHD